MKIYNTLTRNIEDFEPIEDKKVKLYSCGPTVYHYAHIGNLRAFIFYDTLKRTLIENAYNVTHVMNITDVGHLVADDDIDDSGEDKMEKGARREGKTAWEVARYYTDAFLKDMGRLNIIKPDFQPRATDFITEQIELIKILESKGFTYITKSGVVFDTSKFENYNKLSKMNLKQLEEGARVESDPEKKNITDFYLWKFSGQLTKREMEWNSPWGTGFPGWHVECSAMAIKLLGDTIDIHCGGIDHIPVHHTNEIAQSETATGKIFSKYWMHNNFLTLSGGTKMAKSGENFYTLDKIIELGFEPIVFRYFILTAHYRSELEFSIESLNAAKQTLQAIRRKLFDHPEAKALQGKDSDYYLKFVSAMNNDLDTPKALAVLHELLDSGLNEEAIRSHLLTFDKYLGLGFDDDIYQSEWLDPERIELEVDGILKSLKSMMMERENARNLKDWKLADTIRNQISSNGFTIEDTNSGSKVKRSLD